MTDKVSIRQATNADVETLVELRLTFEREIGFAKDEALLPALRQATKQYFLEALPTGQFLAWVAEAEGRIVATSGLIFFQKPPSEQNLTGLEAYILNMYTLPAWRGQGIARRLLQVLLDAAKERQAHRVWLYATPGGQPLYTQAGFVPKHRKNPEMELLW